MPASLAEIVGRDAEFVRVLSFAFSKVFDSVPRDIVTEKLKQTNLSPISSIVILRIENKESWLTET
jgi:hypothetical protein